MLDQLIKSWFTTRIAIIAKIWFFLGTFPAKIKVVNFSNFDDIMYYVIGCSYRIETYFFGLIIPMFLLVCNTFMCSKMNLSGLNSWSDNMLTVLDAILNILNFPRVPDWHQMDPSSRGHWLPESVNKVLADHISNLTPLGTGL